MAARLSETKLIESPKQESFIQIGKHSHRIATDHHGLLVTLSNDYRYLSMEQLLFFSSFHGAKVLHIFNPLALINAFKRGEGA